MRAHSPARAALSLLALLLCLLPAGCAGAPAQRVLLLADGLEGYYWSNLIEGAELAAREAGWTLETRLRQAETPLAEQLPRYGEAELCVLALDGAQGQAAAACEVPLAALGCEISGADTTHTGEETTIGKRTGQLIAGKIGLQKRFLLLTSAEYASQDDWEVALRGELGQHGSLVAGRLAAKEEEAFFTYCFDELRKDGSIDGILCRTEAASRGALRAVRLLGLQTPIVAADFDADIALGLRDGLVRFSVVRNAYAYGYAGVEAALRRAQGGSASLPERVDALYIDVYNMYDEELQPYLYAIE